MTRVSERVWRFWHDASEQGAAEAIELLFRSTLPREDAWDALLRAAREVMEAREREHADDEFSTGACSLVHVPEGIVLRVDEWPQELEALLGAIGGRLAAAGIDGEFELFRPEARLPPETAHLLECRLRVRGGRFHYRGPNHGWAAELDALDAGVEAGIAWCAAHAPERSLALTVGLTRAVRLRPHDDVRFFFRKGLEAKADLGVVRLSSVGDERFRTLAVDPSRGRVSLIEGGPVVERDWRAALTSFVGVVREAAPWAVYGFVKRGSVPEAAELAMSLDRDWVPIAHRNPLWAGGEAFENELVPDAFGVQLLGPGYAGAVPTGPDWRASPVGHGAVVLEHVAPDTWFARLFGTSGGYRTTPTDPALIPPVVARARGDFGRVLFTDDVAFEHTRCGTTR